MPSLATIKKYVKPIFILVIRLAGIFAVYKICIIYDWKNVGSVLQWNSAAALLSGAALYTLKQIIDALRSKRIATALNAPIPISQLLKFNIQSISFDFVLPIPQAEEVYRFSRFIAYTNKKTAILLAICIRATGLIATLISLAIAVTYMSLKLKPLFANVNRMWIYFLLFDLALGLLLASVYVTKKRSSNPMFAQKYIDQIKLVIQSFNTHKYYLTEGICLSFLSQMLYAGAIFFLCYFAGAQVSFFHAFLIIPLIYFAALVPVGMAGLGIKEAVIAWALGQFGVLTAIAWKIALFHLVIMMFYLLIGAILLLAEPKENLSISKDATL